MKRDTAGFILTSIGCLALIFCAYRDEVKITKLEAKLLQSYAAYDQVSKELQESRQEVELAKKYIIKQTKELVR